MECSMSEKKFNLFQAGEQLGVGYTTVRRYVSELCKVQEVEKIRTHTGHLASVITQQQIDWIKNNLLPTQSDKKKLLAKKTVDSGEVGFFYVILLVPEFSKTRIKIGFTNNVSTRLSSHQCAAPTAKLLKHWKCKRNWEGFLTDIVTKHGTCIRSEVFDVSKLDPLFKDIEKVLDVVKNTMENK
jgi:hypothetical protein